MYGFTIPIVRTYIQCDMHDGGEGGLYPPLLCEVPWDLESMDSKGRERGVVYISLAVALLAQADVDCSFLR